MEPTVADWEREFEHLYTDYLALLLGRKEVRQRSHSYLKALLGPVERKNGWQMAEAIGQATPDGAQRLLNSARWDPDLVRDALRAYVVDNIGDRSGVLIIDETGFLKKGTKSVGVQRQYSGTAGRIENCQIGVFLCYATSRGAAFMDRELYLPESWASDPERRKEAGVPEEVTFATKPELARRMVLRALDAGVPCAWVTGDEVYGADRMLRFELEQRQQPFVLAVAAKERLMVSPGGYKRADVLAKEMPAEAWQRLSAGFGSKGPRLYDWAWTPLYRLQITPQEKAQGHWLLVRRSIADPSELAYYVVFAPRTTTLETAAQVAGMRWNIEGGFECAKSDCGLDQYEVRKWHAWYRYITLCLLAHAFLIVVRSQYLPDDNPAKRGDPKRHDAILPRWAGSRPLERTGNPAYHEQAYAGAP